MPLTEQEKEVALQALAERRANQPEKVNNADLYAGSPMFFYCHYCGHVSEIAPEDYTHRPSHICAECKKLLDAGVELLRLELH